MLDLFESPYNTRYSEYNKRKCDTQEGDEECGNVRKRSRNFDYIAALPDEILMEIFSNLTIQDLYFCVRPVCTKWREIAMLSPKWWNVTVDTTLPTSILRNWIRLCPAIRHFTLVNRDDVSVVLEEMSKRCHNLESLAVINCWGSPYKVAIMSQSLCNLLTRCKKLAKIKFERVRIRSCKFFKLLGKRRENGKFIELSYLGPVTSKQYNALKESSSGWVFTEIIT